MNRLISSPGEEVINIIIQNHNKTATQNEQRLKSKQEIEDERKRRIVFHGISPGWINANEYCNHADFSPASVNKINIPLGNVPKC